MRMENVLFVKLVDGIEEDQNRFSLFILQLEKVIVLRTLKYVKSFICVTLLSKEIVIIQVLYYKYIPLKFD